MLFLPIALASGFHSITVRVGWKREKTSCDAPADIPMDFTSMFASISFLKTHFLVNANIPSVLVCYFQHLRRQLARSGCEPVQVVFVYIFDSLSLVRIVRFDMIHLAANRAYAVREGYDWARTTPSEQVTWKMVWSNVASVQHQ